MERVLEFVREFLQLLRICRSGVSRSINALRSPVSFPNIRSNQDSRGAREMVMGPQRSIAELMSIESVEDIGLDRSDESCGSAERI